MASWEVAAGAEVEGLRKGREQPQQRSLGVALYKLPQHTLARVHQGICGLSDRRKRSVGHPGGAYLGWGSDIPVCPERLGCSFTTHLASWGCGISCRYTCASTLLFLDRRGVVRLYGQRGGRRLGRRMMLTSSIPFRCSKCDIAFQPAEGGACYVCDRPFCRAHLHFVRVGEQEVTLCDEDSIWSDRLHEDVISGQE